MRRARIAAALCVLLVLGACSVLSVAYDNADRIALAYVDDWFDLDRTQGKRFRERFRERMDLHRRDELPRYVAFLGSARALVGGEPSPAELEALFTGARELIELGIRRSLPLMADTLAELSPAQVEHLAAELAESNAEEAEEIEEDTPAERLRDRQKELIKEFERWTGRLDEAQRAQLRELATRLPDGARTWLDYRKERQRGLLAVLRGRAGRDALVAYAEEWWLGDRHFDPQLAAQVASNRRITAAALARLVASLTPKQRSRVQARIDDIVEDLEELHAAAPAQGKG